MSNKEQLSIDEIFYAMPKLRVYFRDREWKIRKYEKREKVESAVEEWRAEREILLEVAQDMDIEDLRIVYYLQEMKSAARGQLVGKIKKLVREVTDFLED